MTELLTSIFGRSLAASTPLLLGTLGEILAERAGVMNLGVEGMMAVGAVTGFAVALSTQSPWLGFLAAVAAGTLMALIHAALTVWLRANQVVSGLALTTLGLGLSGIIGRQLIGKPLPEKFSCRARIALPDVRGFHGGFLELDVRECWRSPDVNPDLFCTGFTLENPSAEDIGVINSLVQALGFRD